MIDHESFGRLRLTHFLAARNVSLLNKREHEARHWIGESYGASEWLRLSDEPELLRLITIDFDSFPAPALRRVLTRLELPFRKGMPLHQVDSLLGSVHRSSKVIAHRETYDFFTSGPHPYKISCRVFKDGGLAHLGAMIPLDCNVPQRI
jgi:hypothetical protein